MGWRARKNEGGAEMMGRCVFIIIFTDERAIGAGDFEESEGTREGERDTTGDGDEGEREKRRRRQPFGGFSLFSSIYM
jgi:hypothetical protein